MSDMGIQLNSSFSFEAWSNAAKENAKNAIVSALTEVGLLCITEARNTRSYQDDTGNLRSSIGFAIVVDGKIVASLFADQIDDGKAKTPEGIAQSKQTVRKVAATKTSGIYLIVAAGMNYAIYVEGRGYNVLTSAELLAERVIPQKLEELGFTVKKK